MQRLLRVFTLPDLQTRLDPKVFHARTVWSGERNNPLGSRLAFSGLCFYIGSHVLGVPLAALGTSWAIWPTLSDVALAYFLLAVLIQRKTCNSSVPTPAQITVFRGMAYLFAGCVVSFLVLVRWYPVLMSDKMVQAGHQAGASVWGEFQIYRSAQCLLLFWLASRVPLSSRRRLILGLVATATLALIGTGIFLDFVGLVRPKVFYPSHLPKDGSAGPWLGYCGSSGGYGMGSIGYNHGHSSLLLFLLTALVLSVVPRRHWIIASLVPFWGLCTVGLTGCRAVFVAAVLWILSQVRGTRSYLMVSLPAMALMLFLLLSTFSDPIRTFQAAWDRQSTLTTSLAEDGFDGRTENWQIYLDFLQEVPERWVVGAGFGSYIEAGTGAHNLYLTIIADLGLFGLAAFALGISKLLHLLRKVEPQPMPLFWVTGCLLLSGFAQETFYPVPAFGHFLGLYVCTIAIVLSQQVRHHSFQRSTQAMPHSEVIASREAGLFIH